MVQKRFIYILLALFAVLLLSACSNTEQDVQEVKIVANEYSIISDVKTFTAGKKYRFVVKNEGKVLHEVLLVPNATDAIGDTSQNHSQIPALIKVEDLKTGESKTVEYTFPESAKGSKPQWACYIEGHHEAGMFLDLEVK